MEDFKILKDAYFSLDSIHKNLKKFLMVGRRTRGAGVLGTWIHYVCSPSGPTKFLGNSADSNDET